MANMVSLITIYVEELLASQVGRAMGLDAGEYGLAKWQGRVCSTCEPFNTFGVSFVPIYSTLPRRALAQFGLNRALELYFGMGPDESGRLLSMLAFDSVIANKDRHFGNFGLLRDGRMELPLVFAWGRGGGFGVLRARSLAIAVVTPTIGTLPFRLAGYHPSAALDHFCRRVRRSNFTLVPAPRLAPLFPPSAVFERRA